MAAGNRWGVGGVDGRGEWVRCESQGNEKQPVGGEKRKGPKAQERERDE